MTKRNRVVLVRIFKPTVPFPFPIKYNASFGISVNYTSNSALKINKRSPLPSRTAYTSCHDSLVHNACPDAHERVSKLKIFYA